MTVGAWSQPSLVPGLRVALMMMVPSPEQYSPDDCHVMTGYDLALGCAGLSSVSDGFNDTF